MVLYRQSLRSIKAPPSWRCVAAQTFILHRPSARRISTSATPQHPSSTSAMGGKAFSDSTFDVEGYLSNRPRYPPHLYTWIRDYLQKYSGNDSSGLLVDIGCGPGFAAFPLLSQFSALHGVDTSASMVRNAPIALQAYIENGHTDLKAKDIKFDVGSSTSMPFVADNSAQCVIAATAAHWFDYAPTWREISRILAPSGSVIWWTYGEHFLPEHPGLQGLINGFMQGGAQDQESIGPYFEQPGRGYLNNLLRDLPFPHDPKLGLDASLLEMWDPSSAIRKTHEVLESGKEGITQIDLSYYFNSTHYARRRLPNEPFRLEQVMSWKQYEGYIRTSSALHSFLKVHPKDAEENGGKDIASRFVEKLKEGVLQQRGSQEVGTGEGLDDEYVRVAWPLGLMAISKKAGK